MRLRLLTAAVVVSALVFLVWLDFHYNMGRPGLLLAPVLVGFALAGAAEALDLLAAQQLRPAPATVYGGVLAVILAAEMPLLWVAYPPHCAVGKLGWPLFALALALTAAFGGEMRRYEKPGGVIINVALAQFVITYLGLCSAFIAALRMFHDNAWGIVALVSLLVVVKMSDAGAYFVGRALGRHKMTPKLSPGKTIEGALGGFLFAAAASYFMFAYIGPAIVGASAHPGDWWRWLVYSIVLTAFGIMGDLAESLLKRDMQRKDSSQTLPGLGGVLDLLDSVLLAAPVAYLCWASGLVGPGGP